MTVRRYRTRSVYPAMPGLVKSTLAKQGSRSPTTARHVFGLCDELIMLLVFKLFDVIHY